MTDSHQRRIDLIRKLIENFEKERQPAKTQEDEEPCAEELTQYQETQ